MKLQYRDGYKIITVRGKSIGEHRHIMQEYLGRLLLWHEHVHHINGIRDDNRLENLMVISTGEHTRLHHTGKVNSPEARLKMSKPKSEEMKRKLSLSRKGIIFSKETKEKMAEAKRNSKGNNTRLSIEQIKEIRLLKKEQKKSNYSLSIMFNINEATVSNIINKRRTYKNL